jgi:hypothetical protein
MYHPHRTLQEKKTEMRMTPLIIWAFDPVMRNLSYDQHYNISGYTKNQWILRNGVESSKNNTAGP